MNTHFFGNYEHPLPLGMLSTHFFGNAEHPSFGNYEKPFFLGMLITPSFGNAEHPFFGNYEHPFFLGNAESPSIWEFCTEVLAQFSLWNPKIPRSDLGSGHSCTEFFLTWLPPPIGIFPEFCLPPSRGSPGGWDPPPGTRRGSGSAAGAQRLW